jgi:uncharacterized protein YbaR (Trm112 family)
MIQTDGSIERLACPETGQPLSVCKRSEAEKRIAGAGSLKSRSGGNPPPYGATDTVLLREDARCAYPIVSGMPILLAPEMLFSEAGFRTFDLTDRKYAEAYQEMAYYNAFSLDAARSFEETGQTESLGFQNVMRLQKSGRRDFLEPRLEWLDATYDCAAQWDAYSHFGSIVGRRVMQLGGSGIHALKMLLGGASEAWLLTPMLGEAVYARAVAARLGLEDAFHCVIGVGEEMPFANETFDVIFSAGCLHHMRTDVAFPEIHRVLRGGGDLELQIHGKRHFTRSERSSLGSGRLMCSVGRSRGSVSPR